MLYTDRGNLIIIEVGANDGSVSFDELERRICEQPSNMVYCETDGALCGIISMGDVGRSKMDDERCVRFNTKFTMLRPEEYMRAKEIFNEHENINEIPVVDSQGRLLGEWARWNDELYEYQTNNIFKSGGVKTGAYTYDRKLYAVMPSKHFPKKADVLMREVRLLREMGADIELTEHSRIPRLVREDCKFLFADEDELRGLQTVYRDLYNLPLNGGRVGTLQAMSVTETAAMLRMLYDRGVYVMALTVGSGKAEAYAEKFREDIKNKFEKIGTMPNNRLEEGLWEDFFDEIYSKEYASEIHNRLYITPSTRSNGTLYIDDIESAYCNVRNGERLTVGQPQTWDKTIWFFGACLVVGSRTEDKHTIESFLQNILNEAGWRIRVVNCGAWYELSEMMQRIANTDIKKGDIVITFEAHDRLAGVPELNLFECLEKYNVPAQWVEDQIYHCNYKVNEIYAKEIYEFLRGKLAGKASDEAFNEVSNEASDGAGVLTGMPVDAYLNVHFPDYCETGVVGAVVMNCNPFTFGHRYLVEQASKRVDRLIVFVVEEDASIFTFAERYAMVCEGVKDLKNVTVVPSGQFILSKRTFKDYFIKVDDGDAEQNAEYDIRLFAEKIAPRLNITYRFMGEEKNDAVTDIYNDAMKRILPRCGIEPVEIERCRDAHGEAISATRVRKMLEACDVNDAASVEVLREYLPDTTIRLLAQRW